MTLFIELKSGATERETASKLEVDIKLGVLRINANTYRERVFSFSLLDKVEVEERGY